MLTWKHAMIIHCDHADCFASKRIEHDAESMRQSDFHDWAIAEARKLGWHFGPGGARCPEHNSECQHDVEELYLAGAVDV